ncbi:Arginase/deacetylase [Cadophora sp. DSE1049]|nr:Arginase/deacetylase [Cadophora sp. DSE1049]
MLATTVTIIFSPYHVGIKDHRVGDGPNRILEHGVIRELESLNVKVQMKEIEPVDGFEGEIGRSFEILRRISTAVTTARNSASFPLILSGNCMATAGVAAGVGIQDPGFIYFDAHDDLETPSINTNGYLDAMGMSMASGRSWHALTKTIPGHVPITWDKYLYVGLRDVGDGQRKLVQESEIDVIWGNSDQKVDYLKELETKLAKKVYGPAIVHLDLDVLDESLGKVNGYESPGGLLEHELVDCLGLVPTKAAPVSLTVCSFDPNLGDGDKIAKIGVRAIVAFVKSLVESGTLQVS